MSVEANTELYERAAECIAYFEGKLPAQVIEMNISLGDLEGLAYNVKRAEAQIAQEEMRGAEIA